MSSQSAPDPSKYVYCCRWGECSTKFEALPELYEHMNSHLSQVPIDELHCKWGDCRYQLHDLSQLVIHVLQHCYHIKLMLQGLNVLKTCNITSRCAGVYNDCIIASHFGSSFDCCWGDCNLSFLKCDLFRDHVAYHAENIVKIPPFPCTWGDDCLYETSRLTNLVRHVCSHAKLKDYACPFCGVLLFTASTLKDHIARTSETDKKEHTCHVCSKAFASAHLLKDHVRFHKPKVSCPHCQQGLACQAHLQRHVISCHSQSGEAYFCHECSYKSRTLRGLRSHLLKHDKSRIFTCDQCVYQTTSYTAFYSHYINSHANKKTFSCHLCVKTFSIGSSLKRHLRLCHNLGVTQKYRNRIFKRQTDGTYSLIESLGRPLHVRSTRSILKPI